MARRQTRRCFRVLRGRYQGRGTAPVLLKRRQFGERAHPYGHVHRQHGAAPRHGWRTAGQGSGRDGAGGIHHAKQRRLDHVRQIPELTAGDTGDHRLAAIILSRVQCYWSKSNAWYRVRRSADTAQRGSSSWRWRSVVRRFRPFAEQRSSRRSGPSLDLHDRAAGQQSFELGRLLVLWYRLFTIPIRTVLAFEARWIAVPNEEDSCRCRRRNPPPRLRAYPDGHSGRHFWRAFAASTKPSKGLMRPAFLI